MAVEQVRHSQVQEGGSVLTDKLAYLRCMVHQLAVEPGSPHKFFSCVADGSVWLVSCYNLVTTFFVIILFRFICC